MKENTTIQEIKNSISEIENGLEKHEKTIAICKECICRKSFVGIGKNLISILVLCKKGLSSCIFLLNNGNATKETEEYAKILKEKACQAAENLKNLKANNSNFWNRKNIDIPLFVQTFEKVIYFSKLLESKS